MISRVRGRQRLPAHLSAPSQAISPRLSAAVALAISRHVRPSEGLAVSRVAATLRAPPIRIYVQSSRKWWGGKHMLMAVDWIVRDFGVPKAERKRHLVFLALLVVRSLSVNTDSETHFRCFCYLHGNTTSNL